jgi:hypothetical protein
MQWGTTVAHQHGVGWYVPAGGAGEAPLARLLDASRGSLCLIKHQAMKTYCGSGCIAARILNLGTRWGGWLASRLGRFTPQEKRPRYQLDRRLGGPQSRSGRGGEEKNSQSQPGCLQNTIFKTKLKKI